MSRITLAYYDVAATRIIAQIAAEASTTSDGELDGNSDKRFPWP
jgi:hypothetical protein